MTDAVSQIDMDPIMTAAPGSPAGDPRASILTLAAYRKVEQQKNSKLGNVGKK